MLVRVVAAAVWLAMVLCGAVPAWGQSQPQGPGQPAEQHELSGLPEALNREAIRDMVSRMSDEEVRRFLIERLDAVATPAAPAAPVAANRSAWQVLAGLSSQLAVHVVSAASGAPGLAAGLASAFATYIAAVGWSGALWFVVSIAAAIVGGLAVEMVVDRLAARWRRLAPQFEPDDTLADQLATLAARFALDMVALIAFFAVTRTIGHALIDESARPLAFLFMLYCIVVPRLTAAVLRFLFAPYRPELRLVCTDDASARFLYRNLVAMVAAIGLMLFLINFMDANGASAFEARAGFWVNLGIFAWLIWIAWRARDGLAMMARGWEPDLSTPGDRMAGYFPWAAIGLVASTWLLTETLAASGRADLLRDGKHYLTLAILLLSPVMDTTIRALVRHMVPPMQGQGELAAKAHRANKRAYIRIGRVIVFGIVIIGIAGLWDVDITSFASEQVGLRIAARLFTVLMILAIGYLAWELATLIFNRKLARETTPDGVDLSSEDAGEGGGPGGSRLSSILPLLRLCAQATIIVMTVLIAAGNLGIDITPLLAGAGIVGLAIGFGAQTLVKDIVSGLFFLIDDAFRIGEYVVIGDTVGTVEKISVRSLQLRHHEGAVHTIPYGSIARVTNNSRDWVIVKMKFTVPFDTDVNRIKKIFKKIGADILEAPYAGDLIQTFKSQGMNGVDDIGIVVRGKFMAKPGTQWAIRKDVYSRIQKAFAENDIEFARREVRVSMPGIDGHNLDADDRKAIAAAAAQAAQGAA